MNRFSNLDSLISMILIPITLLLLSGCNTYRRETTAKCPPLPTGFTKSDIVGTWIGHYFSNTDKLIIREDGTYKQVYSGDFYNFESDWHSWHLEIDDDGFMRLHLEGMRRCDGLDEECNDPNGGLPSWSKAMNPCVPGYVILDDEVILFVTGITENLPRGIIIQQARLAGSEWTYSFILEE